MGRDCRYRSFIRGDVGSFVDSHDGDNITAGKMTGMSAEKKTASNSQREPFIRCRNTLAPGLESPLVQPITAQSKLGRTFVNGVRNAQTRPRRVTFLGSSRTVSKRCILLTLQRIPCRGGSSPKIMDGIAPISPFMTESIFSAPRNRKNTELHIGLHLKSIISRVANSVTG